jgi:D-alanyl-D-alanine carboxypeptidase/D-alanyl-D-alanine-endopeptidase (penicillin-binding protein 4)
VRLATRDPVPEAGRALLHALEERGVRVHGGLRVAWDSGQVLAAGCHTGAVTGCAAYGALATLRSPPLMEIVEAILEPSQNWIAEQLVRSLGETTEGRASWSAARGAVRSVLADSLGVDTLDVHVVDGSGLSAYNLVTPRALARILDGVAGRPWGEAYREALPTPGEEESTLENRLDGLGDRFHAKTGTITHVSSLSGYLTTDTGRELIVVLVANGSGRPSSEVRAALDEVVRQLAADGGDGRPPPG